MKKLISISISIFLFSFSVSFASEIRISGIYSNLYYHEEAGDLLGEEFIIFPSKHGYSALIQIAQGGFPYAALVPVKVKGNQISFSLPQNGNYSGGFFKGIITTDYIEGSFSGSIHLEKIKLNKGNSYWQ